VLICNHCLQRVNEACRTIKDIIESDEEYFEKLRNGYKENEMLASHEVKVEKNQFPVDHLAKSQAVKKERVEVKQEVEENSNNPTIWNARAVLREFESLRKEHEAVEAKKSATEEASSYDKHKETTAEADQQRSKRRRSLTDSTEEPPEKRKAAEVSTENVEIDPIEPGEDGKHEKEKLTISSVKRPTKRPESREKLDESRITNPEIERDPKIDSATEKASTEPTDDENEQTKRETKARQVKTKKTKQTIFKCHICTKTFNLKSNLRIHIEKVHEKKKKFTCSHCSKGFYFKYLFQSHLVIHEFTSDSTTNSNRPFRCDVNGCGKFYKNKIGLHMHQRYMHDKLTQVKCLICSKMFSSKHNLKRHQEKRHRESPLEAH
jgi:hypothetical protein